MPVGHLWTNKTYRALVDDLEHEFRLWKVGDYAIPTHTVAMNAGGNIHITFMKDGKEVPLSCVQFSGESRAAERNLCALRDVVCSYRKMEQRGIAGVMSAMAQALALPDPNNAYHIIGASPDATDEELSQAYRKRRRQVHPDTPGGSRVEWDRVERAAHELGIN